MVEIADETFRKEAVMVRYLSPFYGILVSGTVIWWLGGVGVDPR
jgi:hypothetical protein